MRPGTPGAGGVTLDHDRLDLGGVDLTGLSREDVLAALTDAALEAFDELRPADFAVALRPVRFVPWAEFGFDPDEPRDEAGKWTAGGGGGSHAFAAAVEETARSLPSTVGNRHDPSESRYTAHKVFVADLYDALGPRLGGMTLDQFKARLLEGHLAGHLALQRDDLAAAAASAAGATHFADVIARSARSEIPHLNAAFHAVDANARANGSLRHGPAAPYPAGPSPAAPSPAAPGPAVRRPAVKVRARAPRPPRPDFTGTDVDGNRWVDGALVAPAEMAALAPARFTPLTAEFYSPDQPRDQAGQWAAGGAGGTKAERSADRVERKRAEKAADRQESGRAKNRNDALAAAHEEIAFTHGAMPKLRGADGYHLHQAVRAAHPDGLRGKPLREKAAAFRRLRDEATRAAAGLRRDPAAQPHLTGDRRANALNGLREIARRAGGALDLIRREATSRRLPGVQSAQFGSADAEFYSPDQPRDDRGRWTAGGGEGAVPRPTQAGRAALRQSSLAAVRAYVRAGGEPTHVEHEQLAAHLARLTVDQLHAVKVEHGLKASGRVKSDLVARLAERFRLHRAKQEPAGKKALAEAVAGREGWHAPRDVMGGHAALHGPTGARVRADSGGTMFDVLTPGSELHSSHATAGEAVRAAEASGRFGTGGTTAEREHAARQEAMRKAGGRAAGRLKLAGRAGFELDRGAFDPGASYAVNGKEPWQMTAREWDAEWNRARPDPSGQGGGAGRESNRKAGPGNVSRAIDTHARLKMGLGDIHDPDGEMAPRGARHREVIDAALAAGKPVPAHVLADYPDLARARARFDDADAPLRPVRFVPLAQPLAPAAPGGQEDARR